MQCTVLVLIVLALSHLAGKEQLTEEQQQAWAEHLAHRIFALREKQLLCDTRVLDTAGGTHLAHACIIIQHCPALADGASRSKQCAYVVRTFLSAESVEKVLQYIYVGPGLVTRKPRDLQVLMSVFRMSTSEWDIVLRHPLPLLEVAPVEGSAAIGPVHHEGVVASVGTSELQLTTTSSLGGHKKLGASEAEAHTPMEKSAVGDTFKFTLVNDPTHCGQKATAVGTNKSTAMNSVCAYKSALFPLTDTATVGGDLKLGLLAGPMEAASVSTDESGSATLTSLRGNKKLSAYQTEPFTLTDETAFGDAFKVEVANGGVRYRCRVCHVVVTPKLKGRLEMRLRNHLKSHLQEVLWCPVCCCAYKGEHGLWEHMKTHGPKTAKYMC